LAALLVGALLAGPVAGAALDIPFDFSHGAIGVDITVHEKSRIRRPSMDWRFVGDPSLR
jgi:hypothetical protein